MNKFEFYKDTIPVFRRKSRWTSSLSEISTIFRINNYSILGSGGRIRSFSEIKYYIDEEASHTIQNIARNIFCIGKLKGRRNTKSIRGVADDNKRFLV